MAGFRLQPPKSDLFARLAGNRRSSVLRTAEKDFPCYVKIIKVFTFYVIFAESFYVVWKNRPRGASRDSPQGGG